jgi:nucleoside-diphosphate-sugar epimerase
MPRKLMSNARIAALGWRPRLTLRDGIRDSYAWYLANVEGRG